MGKRTDEWLVYLTQRGVAEWDEQIDYPTNALTQFAGEFYIALEDNRNQRPDRSQHVWQTLMSALGGVTKVNNKTGEVTLTSDDVNALSINGGTIKGSLNVNGEVMSTSANGYRIAYSDYGVFWRNDGLDFYLMLTDKGSPTGNYNSLRPLRVNLATGDLTLGKVAVTDWTNIDSRYYTKTEVDSRVNVKAVANTASKAANGWWRCGSTGLIIQWGFTANIGVGWRQVTLPIAFPNLCLSALATYELLRSVGGTRGVAVVGNTALQIPTDNCNTFWIAIGY